MTAQIEHFDLVVVGFGKAGKTLAMKRAKAGDRVVLIERDAAMYGGTCINIGCVPTKTLISRMEVFEASGAADGPTAFKKAQEYRDALVAKMNAANKSMVESSGVELVLGSAEFTGPKTVLVRTPSGERLIEGGKIVIDTGSEPVLPTFPGSGLPRVHTSTSIQHVESLPGKLIIVGGGPIGLEFATLFSGFGTEVHILDRGPRPLRKFEPEIADHATGVLEKRGVVFHLNAQPCSFEEIPEGIQVVLEDGRRLDADAVLYAVGRRPATEGLGLDRAGIGLQPNGAVKVDSHLRTNIEGVYAAGDVNGGPQFTYVSYDDHRIILSDAWGIGDPDSSTEGRVLPTTVFMEPPLSSVGLSERAAVEAGFAVAVKEGIIADMAIVPRPKILGHPEGMVKFVLDEKTDRILGATFFCVDSQELVNTVAIAMRSDVTAHELGDGIYTHPSSSEIFNAVLG